MVRRSIALALAGIGVLAATWACASDDDTAPQVGSGGVGGAGAAGGGGTGATSGSGGTGGTVSSGGTGAVLLDAAFDGWAPPGDPEWTQVDWAGCTPFYVAKHPENALPPMKFVPCAGSEPGCTQWEPPWPIRQYGFIASKDQPVIYKTPQGLYVPVTLRASDDAVMSALYDPTGSPIGAWLDFDAYSCVAHLVQASARHVCVAVGGANTKTHVALFPTDALAGPALRQFDTLNDILHNCGERILIGANNEPAIGDLDTGEQWLARDVTDGGILSEMNHLSGWGDLAFASEGRTVGNTRLWRWRLPHEIALLRETGKRWARDVKSDGSSVVWVESDTGYGPGPGELWTSPLTSDALLAAPRKVRDLAVADHQGGMVGYGGGYYAMTILAGTFWGEGSTLHLYRMTDGHHWTVPELHLPTYPKENMRSEGVAYLDAEEIIWVGSSKVLSNYQVVLVRQRLDALGPGDDQ